MRDQLNDPANGADNHPEALARKHSRPPLPKRFYSEVSVVPLDGGGFGIGLDGRIVKTPAKAALAMPTEAAAQLIAAEFDCQKTQIDPSTMPVTRLANTAIDGVAADPQAVFEDVLRFSSSDLLCYRAGTPEKLVALQSEAWDPVLELVRNRYGAQFVLSEGVMHVEQPRAAITAIGVAMKRHEHPIAFAAIHSMTSLTGSALLAICVADGLIDVHAAWDAAHVDEDWNISLWGDDAEAARRRAFRQADMLAAANLLAASGGL